MWTTSYNKNLLSFISKSKQLRCQQCPHLKASSLLALALTVFVWRLYDHSLLEIEILNGCVVKRPDLYPHHLLHHPLVQENTEHHGLATCNWHMPPPYAHVQGCDTSEKDVGQVSCYGTECSQGQLAVPDSESKSHYVAWTMRSNLSCCDCVLYEHDISAWESKDRKLSGRVGKPSHLPLPYKEHRVLIGRSVG